jgi:hypothetical protein
MGIMALNIGVALIANLIFTVPLSLFFNRRISVKWVAIVLTTLMSTGLVNLLFYALIHFQIIMAHESAYLILVGPYAVTAFIVSFLMSKFISLADS